MKNTVLVISIFLMFFSGCTSDDEALVVTDSQLGYNYSPLQLNQVSIYQIDSVKYDDFTGRTDTFIHQRREVVEEIILDAENREAFNIGIYRRVNDTAAWQKMKVIRKTRTERRLEVLEDNVVRIDLVFPLLNDVEWNPNSLNAGEKLEYIIKDLNTAFTYNNTTYDSTLTVGQVDEENLIERKFAEEIYATNKGLVYRKAIDLETEVSGEIRSGYDVTVRLITFKK